MTPDPSLSILIAEDDDAAAHLIGTNLKRSGLSAASFFRAKNGEEAISLINGASTTDGRAIPKDDKLIILLDIRMPKLDGIQVLKTLKESPSLKRIPVVMLTTSDRPQEVDLCYSLGCNLYLKKQVDYAKFTDSIARLAAFLLSCEIPLFGELKND